MIRHQRYTTFLQTTATQLVDSKYSGDVRQRQQQLQQQRSSSHHPRSLITTCRFSVHHPHHHYHHTYDYHHRYSPHRLTKKKSRRTTTTMLLSTAASISAATRSTGIGALLLRTVTTTPISATVVAMMSYFSTTSITIAVTLLLSAFIGLWVEQQQQQQGVNNNNKKWTKFLPPSIVVTLLTSTFLVHLLQQWWSIQLPQQHALYDYCWSTILPSSLALLLLSLPTSTTTTTKSTRPKQPDSYTRTGNAETHNSVLSSIQRLAIPFLMASIGSITGCLLSFVISYFTPNCSLLLDRTDASPAAACLCASFIGGSINFFTTSVIIQQQQSSSSSNHHALLSSMAAVDIVVMAIYFSILSAALQSSRLQQWYNGNDDDDDDDSSSNSNSDQVPQLDHTTINDESSRNDNSVQAPGHHETQKFEPYLIPVAIVIGSLSLVLVEVSNRLELILLNRFHIPGTACAFLAIMVPWITTSINKIYNRNTRIDFNSYNLSNPFRWERIQLKCVEPMSRMAFLLVFATMGCTVDLNAAFYNGPACLFFSFTALIVHGFVTLFGSLLFRRFRTSTMMMKNSNHGMERFADVLIASNAAIGGPATAAAFCGQIQSNDPLQKRNLTIAATVWGVVGYAIGTTIGVTMYRILQSLV